MKDIKLNKKLLESMGACYGGLNFLERNKLDGIPLSTISKIIGDYDGYIEYIKEFTFNNLPNGMIEVYNDGTTTTYDSNYNVIKSAYGSIEIIYEYDNNGNLIHYKESDGYEYWYTYDENNNITKYEDSDNNTYWKVYDNNGNLISKKYIDGSTMYRDYDENNNLIHEKTKNEETWFRYDSYGNNICTCSTVNGTTYRDYDNNNRLVKASFPDRTTVDYEYDKYGNMVHYISHKNKNGVIVKTSEYWQEFDENSNLIYYKDGKSVSKYEYDENNNCIHKREISGDMISSYWREYDNNSNEIAFISNNGTKRYSPSKIYDDGQLKQLGKLKIPYFEK